ncbi:major antigenic peptide / PpiC-type peptidyl-prolyl cis-trans isomerase [Campylobacter blaseri]|uniref:peptidylprolyl isomerase n=1 Tax=Campylobacter blaseri TaxID=2042961 RepID=A0A2P8R262_9BACT|nr:peptidylprolyl isomerase [Campylobacter blaseri]PSM52581.1 peptidylprolyl isomerase [Campylobacter blaseri]PSM54229.1 peptidylprolyl isomerase [Campylobacter blaseri]QKF85880.1 major antigenic peptide / PpiC-type peptidyl-prolyl cis-trans isomerase [Campylobacter blaseri]
MNKLLLGALSLAVAVSLNAKVYATIDGQDVTDIDLVPLLAGAQGVVVSELPEDVRKQLVERAVQIKLLTNEAIKSGIKKDELFKKELKLAEDGLALRVWQIREMEKTKVSDEEIKKFYNDNKDKFIEKEAINASHILVEKEEDAKKIIDELKNLKGEELKKKFAEVAKEKSIEPMAKKTGGDLGWFSPSQMVEAFANVAKELKDGEISKTPVKTQFGYHVILKNESRAERQATLEETKAFITSNLKQEKFQKNLDKQIEELVKKAKVEYKK